MALRLIPALWITASLAATAGCGHSTTVRGSVVYPAAIPVRVFPRILVAGGDDPADRELVGALTAHLRGEGRSRVRSVSVDELEPMRRAGRIRAPSVVLLLESRLRERTQVRWITQPETVCGPIGCFSQNRSRMVDVPVVEGRVSVTVYEGPTARVLQRATVHARGEGRDFLLMRRQVTWELGQRLSRMVDQRRDHLDVVLLAVGLPGVDAAIEAIDGGDWTAGREALERLADSAAGRALEPEDRARLLYDLGQARRFDPATLADTASHFGRAEEALREAVRLDPAPRYAEALRAARAHHRQVVLVREQRAAAAHNFALRPRPAAAEVAPIGDIPAPPPGYR